jgi:heptosyltransferase-2
VSSGTRFPPGRPGPLLLRLPNWLGDLVLALPVVEAAVRARPGALLLVGPGAFEPLLAPRVPGARYLGWSRASRFALAGPLRAARPATALLLTESLSSALLARLSGAPVRIGFAAEWRRLLLTHPVPRPSPARGTPRTDEYRALARAAGLPVTGGPPRLRATDAERSAARDLLASRNVTITAPALVLAPGAGYGPAKRWPPDRFAAVARRWRERRGGTALLVGAREDAEAARRVAEEARGAAVDLCGGTSLPALLGLLEGAAAVVSNDSGVMHVAAALGRPTVAIFGSTSPAWTSASVPWVRNLYAAYPCSPCFRRRCDVGYGCLAAVGDGDVWRAIDDVLVGAGGARAEEGKSP